MMGNIDQYLGHYFRNDGGGDLFKNKIDLVIISMIIRVYGTDNSDFCEISIIHLFHNVFCVVRINVGASPSK